MITIQKLAEFGADTDSGLKRCMNNEAFYLRLVGLELNDSNFETLRQAIDAGDPGKAFEAAHALKGAVGNLSLTPISEPVSLLTEALRGASGMPEGADALARKVFDAYGRLKAMAE